MISRVCGEIMRRALATGTELRQRSLRETAPACDFVGTERAVPELLVGSRAARKAVPHDHRAVR